MLSEQALTRGSNTTNGKADALAENANGTLPPTCTSHPFMMKDHGAQAVARLAAPMEGHQLNPQSPSFLRAVATMCTPSPHLSYLFLPFGLSNTFHTAHTTLQTMTAAHSLQTQIVAARTACTVRTAVSMFVHCSVGARTCV